MSNPRGTCFGVIYNKIEFYVLSSEFLIYVAENAIC